MISFLTQVPFSLSSDHGLIFKLLAFGTGTQTARSTQWYLERMRSWKTIGAYQSWLYRRRKLSVSYMHQLVPEFFSPFSLHACFCCRISLRPVPLSYQKTQSKSILCSGTPHMHIKTRNSRDSNNLSFVHVIAGYIRCRHQLGLHLYMYINMKSCCYGEFLFFYM